MSPALVLFAATLLPGQAGSGETISAQIEQAIENLASSSFADRQRASDLLWHAGRAAEPALRRALESGDPEVAFRARSILEQFRYGIYPDTPPQVVRLITTYRDGDLNVKRAALKQLQDQGDAALLLVLLKNETNEVFREQLVREFARDAETIVPELLVAGKLEDAELLLDLAASSTDEGMRHLAVLLLQTGKLDQRVADLQAQLETQPSDSQRRLLVYLLRTAGKPAEALAAAEALDQRFDFMREALQYEQRDWPALARGYDDALAKNEGLAGNIEYLSYAAAFHRLSGDAVAFERDVDKIKNLTAGDAEQIWYCAEALLVNARFDEGIALLREARPEAAFRLLAAQMRYREAFELAGLDSKGADASEWFRELARDLQSDDEELRARLALGLAVARALVRIGGRERAVEGLATIGTALAEDKDGRRLAALCAAERKLGLDEQAFDHAALALAKGPAESVLADVFGDQRDTASVWWQYFSRRHPDELQRATLDRVATILKPPSDATDRGVPAPARSAAPLPDDWQKLVDEAAAQAASLEVAQRAQWLRALAETCLLQDDRPRAKSLLAEAAPLSSAAALRLADLFVEDNAWPDAAKWYETASADANQRPLAMYLRGRALEQAGDAAEGRRWMELARLLPLAEAARRRVLADGLKERKLTDAAVAEWELVLRTTAFRDWYSSNASLNLGNTISGKDHLAAAAHWEALALSVLKTNSSFIEVEGYLQLPHLVHKSRARGLLARGKHDEALANLKLSRAAYPGNIDLAEDLIPELEAAGLRSAADELFESIYLPNEQLCLDYPQHASAHNNLAWLAARSGRRLEEARTHARRAVELEPENAAYLDTLAESLFRTGSRAEAIELAERCLKKEPNNEHFQQQLARFRSGQ
jgi:hypothetical protein